jgi:hypothetical protein
VSRPTKKLVASGGYDPAAARQRIAEWKGREAGQGGVSVPRSVGASVTAPLNPVAAAMPQQQAAPAPKSAAPTAAPSADFDPEVGF